MATNEIDDNERQAVPCAPEKPSEHREGLEAGIVGASDELADAYLGQESHHPNRAAHAPLEEHSISGVYPLRGDEVRAEAQHSDQGRAEASDRGGHRCQLNPPAEGEKSRVVSVKAGPFL